MYSFIWISFEGVGILKTRAQRAQTKSHNILNCGAQSCHYNSVTLVSQPYSWSQSQGGVWLRESRSCDKPLWRVVWDIPMQKSTLLFHTHPSYQATPSSLFPVWPYFQIPFSTGQEFHEYIQWTMITQPLLSPSSSSEIPQHASPQLNVVLKTSNIHGQL